MKIINSRIDKDFPFLEHYATSDKSKDELLKMAEDLFYAPTSRITMSQAYHAVYKENCKKITLNLN